MKYECEDEKSTKILGVEDYERFKLDLMGFVDFEFPELKNQLHTWQKDFLVRYEEGLKKGTILEKFAIVGVKNCGKTLVSGLIALFTLMTQKNSVIVFLSGTRDQTKAVSISQLKTLIAKSEHLDRFLKPTNERVKFIETSVAIKRNTDIRTLAFNTKGGSTSILSGRHGDVELFFFDEADTIPKEVFDQLIVSVRNTTRVIMTANPEIQTGGQPLSYCGQIMNGLEDIAGNSLASWTRIPVTLAMCDKFTPEQIQAIKLANGYPDEKNPLYIRNVLGQYQVAASTVMFESHILKDIFDQNIYTLPDVFLRRSQQACYGVDVAYGKDRDFSVIVYRVGIIVYVLYYSSLDNDLKVANKLLELYRTFHSVPIYIDELGIGGAVFGRLTPLIDIKGVNAHTTIDDQFCETKQTLLYGFISDLIKHKALKIRFLADTQGAKQNLVRESAGIIYAYTKSGKKVVEKKNRTSHTSPDVLDAISFTFSEYSREKFDREILMPALIGRRSLQKTSNL